MKKCEQIQLQIVEENYCNDVQEHLKQCVECSDFASFHQSLMTQELKVQQTPTLNDILMRKTQQKYNKIRSIKRWSAVASLTIIATVGAFMGGIVRQNPAVQNSANVSDILYLSWDEKSELDELNESFNQLEIAVNENLNYLQ